MSTPISCSRCRNRRINSSSEIAYLRACFCAFSLEPLFPAIAAAIFLLTRFAARLGGPR
jgi:hypothetical protein